MKLNESYCCFASNSKKCTGKENYYVLKMDLTKALNDDLPSTLTVHQVAETGSKIDCPINDPDAILQIRFSGRHISVNWTIMGRSSLCYLMDG